LWPQGFSTDGIAAFAPAFVAARPQRRRRIADAARSFYPPPNPEEPLMPRSPALFPLSALAAGLALAAAAAGTAWGGEAGKQCSIAPINGCNLGWYCRIQAPITPAKLGYCAKVPDSCPQVNEPVCGVNGQTYQSACHASKDAENIAHDGPCPKAQ
jgi:hypothetical protein